MRRSVPPKPPFPGCLGGTRLWAHQWRTAKDLPASPVNHCGRGLPECLNTTVSPRSNPLQRALPHHLRVLSYPLNPSPELPEPPYIISTSSVSTSLKPATMPIRSSHISPSAREAECPECGKRLSRRSDIKRHRRSQHPDGTEFKYVWHDTIWLHLSHSQSIDPIVHIPAASSRPLSKAI